MLYNMLVVDDEIYALKGITQGIDWSDQPLSAILEAGSVKSAMEIMERQPVDLVISDIEMQETNGLQLLRWIHERFPHTLVVFLTGHARFEYAREALQLGCFDYALKPIDHDLLKEIVARALKEIQEQKKRENVEALIEQHLLQWKNRLPVLVERFWQDLIAGRISLQPERLNRQFELYDIPLKAGGRVLPLLLSIEHWSVDMSARDETIMEYAIRKAAADILFGELPGVVLQDSGGLNLILLYCPEDLALDRAELLKRCRQFMTASEGSFHCQISCYVGSPAPAEELSGAIDRLLQTERTNVSSPQSVIDAALASDAAATGGAGAMPNLAEWGELLDQGLQDEVIRQLEQTTRRLQDEMTSRETLEQLYYGLLHLFYQTAHRKGVSVYEVLTVQELNDPQASRSPQHLLAWAARLASKIAEESEGRQRDSSPIIAKAYAYIQDNLQRDLTRDDIAAVVSRNPAYLSRLFRKETGLSLSEYITQQRIEQAKKLLAETDDKISSIAEGLGYLHFSYFAKLFRKLTGLTPQDYRKKYRAP
ncbi:helix-turn-helix domain-containing protein [Paenibacillus stellifer]|uniref:helix-turn-helix domain-containing protein n=1 Tax=Paenibacillus stellifer TaxID=169760 RepID=UPI00068D2493|nr:helix-turn-helix domain-containing protein [Paenibacillus stellifer]